MDWLVPSYTLFGNKWAQLHHVGGDIIEQRGAEDVTVPPSEHVDAKVTMSLICKLPLTSCKMFPTCIRLEWISRHHLQKLFAKR